MVDYTKFITYKNQLQKLYNYKAKEEREIIFATKYTINPTSSSMTLNTKNLLSSSTLNTDFNNMSENPILSAELILLTVVKNIYYFEQIRVEKDINFIFSSNLMTINKLIVKSDTELILKIGEKEIDIVFLSAHNLKEFVWCIIHIAERIRIENQIQIKNINHKDLEDYAQKNNFNAIYKLMDEEKKKDKYDMEISDKELENLRHTLYSINIGTVIHYDLENLNSKVEEFNIETKESFLQILQGTFKKSIEGFLESINRLDGNINNILGSLKQDNDAIEGIWHNIQKIEDANHRIELRNENKRKLDEFMIKLLEQLSISESKRQTLENCKYLNNSELVIVNEVLTKFIKFYQSRKRQDIKMEIIKEGQETIREIIEVMMENFNKNMYDYISKSIFKETYLLKNMPSFNTRKILPLVSELNERNLKARSKYLNSFILDRRFFIEKINILLGQNQDEKIATNQLVDDTMTHIAKAIRDNLAVEFNNANKLWQFFFDAEILNGKYLDIYLNNEDILNYNAFEKIETDYLFESSKYFATIILNSFFVCDSCMDTVLQFFSESPLFNIERKSVKDHEIETTITKKLYESLEKNFIVSIEKNILFGFVIYSILSAIQEKISKNVMEDITLISIKEIFDADMKIEESYISTLTERSDLQNSSHSVIPGSTTSVLPNYNLEEIGISKISLQRTLDFIINNMKNLSSTINKFLLEQKEIIQEYVCEPRRIGVIPIVKKTVNFLKLLVALTLGIKQDYIIDICDDFRTRLKTTIEKIAKMKPKYTNIILMENYFFIYGFYRSFENVNIINPKVSEYENLAAKVFSKYKADYVKELFDYQFKEFAPFYDKFVSQYETQGKEISIQQNYNFNIFDKQATLFIKELPKQIEKLAKRIIKHLTKELELAPIIWREMQMYLINTLKYLEDRYVDTYGKQANAQLITAARDSVNNFNFANAYKPK